MLKDTIKEKSDTAGWQGSPPWQGTPTSLCCRRSQVPPPTPPGPGTPHLTQTASLSFLSSFSHSCVPQAWWKQQRRETEQRNHGESLPKVQDNKTTLSFSVAIYAVSNRPEGRTSATVSDQRAPLPLASSRAQHPALRWEHNPQPCPEAAELSLRCKTDV